MNLRYIICTQINALSGVYIYTKRSNDPQRRIVHTLLYIGETDSFKRHLNQDNDTGKRCSLNQGADFICVYQEGSNRGDIEQSLIKKYTTPCNRT